MGGIALVIALAFGTYATDGLLSRILMVVMLLVGLVLLGCLMLVERRGRRP